MLTSYFYLTGLTLALFDLVKWFADHTAAKAVDGSGEELKKGNTILEFRPTQRAESKTTNTLVKVVSTKKYVDDAKFRHEETTFNSKAKTSSAVVTLQTILPWLLMIGNYSGHNVAREVLVEGPTNCRDAPSFEYLKQVFEPALKKYFDIELDCKLEARGWGHTPVSSGKLRVKFMPLSVGSTIKVQDESAVDDLEEVTVLQRVVATIVAPATTHTALHQTLHETLTSRYGYLAVASEHAIKINLEESKHANHVYVMLVAHADSPRWARDWTSSESVQGSDKDLANLVRTQFAELCDELDTAVAGCPVDPVLQDQLFIYQALAEGASTFQGDTKHVQRDRHVVAKMLPEVTFGEGSCTGAGIKVGQHVKVESMKQELEKQ